jgi:hypothetical protein
MIAKDGSVINTGHSAKLNTDGIWEYDLSKGLKTQQLVKKNLAETYKEVPELKLIPIIENQIKASYSHLLKSSIDKILNRLENESSK